MNFKIQENESETKGSFYIAQEDKVLAQMTYSKAGTERIIIDHTEVGDSLRGQGAGLQLVEYAVNFVRD